MVEKVHLNINSLLIFLKKAARCIKILQNNRYYHFASFELLSISWGWNIFEGNINNGNSC